MAYESDSITRRTVGPALASAIVGAIIGTIAVLGVREITAEDSLPIDTTSQAVIDNAVLGGPEYGTRGIPGE